MLLILIKCVNLLILCLQTNLLPTTASKRKIIKEQVNGCAVNCDFSVACHLLRLRYVSSSTFFKSKFRNLATATLKFSIGIIYVVDKL